VAFIGKVVFSGGSWPPKEMLGKKRGKNAF